MSSEKTCEPLRCQFAWRLVRATLKNTSCRNSRRGRLALWALGGTCEEGRQARKSAWSEESKRGDGILGTPGPHWWDSHRQERPRLLVPICSLERPLPRVTVVPQYHLSARPIRLWDKAVSLSLEPLNTAGKENSLRSLISLNLKRCINPGKVKITAWVTLVRESEGKRNVINAGFSMFPLRGQKKTWNLLKSYTQELVFPFMFISLQRINTRTLKALIVANIFHLKHGWEHMERKTPSCSTRYKISPNLDMHRRQLENARLAHTEKRKPIWKSRKESLDQLCSRTAHVVYMLFNVTFAGVFLIYLLNYYESYF